MSVQIEKLPFDAADDYQLFARGCRNALVQHTWEWSRVITDLGEDQALFFLARDNTGRPVGGLPAYFFPCQPVSLLLSVPQAGGYGGVLYGDERLKEDIYASLLEAFLNEAQSRQCALATISTPPFFNDLELYRRYLEPDIEHPNFYQYLDLEGDFMAGISSKQRGNIKRSLKKACDYGLKIILEDSSELFDQWYDIHLKRMAELDTLPLPRQLFESARQYLLDQGLGFFAYVLDSGRVIAGGLFVGLNRVIDVFFMSSDSDYTHKQPNNLMISAAIDQARRLGFCYLNWQSCSSRQSGVYKYKQNWGSREGLHHYLTRVTGDISTLEELPLEEIKIRYQWHYVMPYEQLGKIRAVRT